MKTISTLMGEIFKEPPKLLIPDNQCIVAYAVLIEVVEYTPYVTVDGQNTTNINLKYL